MSSHSKYQNKNPIFQMSLFGYKLQMQMTNSVLLGTYINKVLIKIKMLKYQKQPFCLT